MRYYLHFELWILLLAQYVLHCSALLEERFVGFESSKGSIAIQNAMIIRDAADPVAVQIATDALSEDFKAITKNKPKVVDWDNKTILGPHKGNAIIVATVNSTLIKKLESAGKVEVSDLRNKWESFRTTTVSKPIDGIDNALVIVGSDKRGTSFGVYTLSEQSGQSPLHYWADVPAARHDEIYALPITTNNGEPSVKYRGLFINDEQPALTGWWAKKHNAQTYPFDTEFYRLVFDLMVRLKANYIWPAMWASYTPKPGRMFFVDDPENQQLADDYGIVVSTSHHEPMQRATNEWTNSDLGKWNWLKNKPKVTAFMEEGVQRAAKNESYFTLGMRGENDGPIDADDPIAVLKDVFETQRSMLAKYYGNETSANQVWTIYKEVMQYYAAGLTPPDDVTLMFTDDNWGNIVRLPNETEAVRSGGFGMYYHMEYVGSPKSYKWQNTNNLAKVYKELYQAYERGVDRIWIMNVGDIKPMEYPYSFAMDLAWNISRFDFDTIPAYLETLAARDFGSKYARDISSILVEQSHLLGMRKFESTDLDTYSFRNFHEAERILTRWKSLHDRTETVNEKLPSNLRDTYYHLIRYPILSGYNYIKVIFGQTQNNVYGEEKRNAANEVALQVISDFENDFDLLHRYDKIGGGKWKGILFSPHFDYSATWRPTGKNAITGLTFVQTRAAYDATFGDLGISPEHSTNAVGSGTVCGSLDAANATQDKFAANLPVMVPHGPSVRTVDLFHRGDLGVPLNWSLSLPNDYPWLHVEPNNGVLSKALSERRLEVSVDWSSVPAGFDNVINVPVSWPGWYDLIRIPVSNQRAPSDFKGFLETAGYISIEAPHFQRQSDGDVSFEKLEYLGTRSENGAIALRPYVAARKQTDQATGAWVEYDIYIFSEAITSVTATAYVTSCLDTDPNLLMQISLTLDSESPAFTRLLTDPSTPGAYPSEWTAQVESAVWTKTFSLGKIQPGKHTLRWQANSPEVYLEKIVLDIQGKKWQTYLGPPETALVE